MRTLFALIAFLASFPAAAEAATMFLVPKTETVSIGDEWEVDLRIDSEDVGFNAAQAAIRFSKDLLEITKLDRSRSIFNIWLEDPIFSNEEGTISFIGGSTAGYSGKSLLVLKIIFKVKGTGVAEIIFSDGAVTA
jgi:hypothetical protein